MQYDVIRNTIIVIWSNNAGCYTVNWLISIANTFCKVKQFSNTEKQEKRRWEVQSRVNFGQATKATLLLAQYYKIYSDQLLIMVSVPCEYGDAGRAGEVC